MSAQKEDLITIKWQDANRNSDCLRYNRALYAVLHPNGTEILYLGKADGSTVKSRRDADDKHERVWDRMDEELGLKKNGFIVGTFYLPEERRLTRELINDVESLLIHRIKPQLNTSSKDSRGYSRPGMAVRCEGCWPLPQRIFRDQ